VKPPLSIVLPALDEAAGIEATLQALEPLRARGVEIVLADGGSGDGTPALAAPWVDAVLQAARGRALQMNAGAAAARGAVLLFLHADTRLPALADCRCCAPWRAAPAGVVSTCASKAGRRCCAWWPP
jgi:glycosyltransferase involved in cell wall biosynthesis